MEASRLRLLILLNSLLLGHVSSKVCRDGWRYYEEENTCLKPNDGVPVYWFTAIDECKAIGGKLINIRTKAKEEFVRRLRPSPEMRTWIGVADFDMDGFFEHMMADEPLLPNNQSGLGDWGSGENMTGPCVSMGAYGEGWRAEDCNNKLAYVCEIELGKSSEIECKNEGWKHFEEGKKYLTVFPHVRKRDLAKTVCRKFGGNLVSILDASTSDAIKGLEGITDDSYWMGLQRDDANKPWEWTDGTALENSDYQKWSSDPKKDENCAAINTASGEWEARNCDKGIFKSICEAQLPCSSRPLLVITLGSIQEFMENGTLSFTKRGKLLVICMSQTGPDSVKNISLSCEWDTDITLMGNAKFPGIKSYADIDLHRKSCWCQTTSNLGLVEVSRMTLHYQTSPFLRNEFESGSTFTAAEGSKCLVTFDAFISPDVQTIELWKNGSVVDVDEYTVMVTAIENSIYSLVEIEILKVGFNSVGYYTLKMDNGMKRSIKFDFALRVTEKKDPSAKNSGSIYILIAGISVAFILLIVDMVAPIMWRLRRSRGTQESKEVPSEQVQEPEDAEHDFVATAIQRTGQSTILV